VASHGVFEAMGSSHSEAASDIKVAEEADKDGKTGGKDSDDFNVLDLLRHLQEQEGYEVYDIFERGRERVPTQVRLWLEDKEDWLATSDASKSIDPSANQESDASGDKDGEVKADVAESDHWVLLSVPPKPAAKGRAKPPGAKGKGPPPPPKRGAPKAKSKPPPPPAPGSKEDASRQPANRRQSIGKAPPPPPFGKRLHWKLLHPATLDNTIFEELQPWDKVAPPLDTKQLERLFTPAERSLGVPISCTAAPPGKAASGKMCLMDPKRAQNLAIILRQVALPTDELCDVVRGLRLQHPISTEALEHIHEFLLPPLLESAEMFASYDGPLQSLRDVERQLLPLARIPRLKARVKCLLFGKTMPGVRAGLQARIRTLQEACNQVRSSHALRRILGTVLRIGNFLNHGIDAPDAAGIEVRGFTMESLLKLRDFRAGQAGESSVTALHCIALHLLPTDPQLPLQLREELKAALEVGGDATTGGASGGPSSNIGELRDAVGRFRREADLLQNEVECHAASYDNAGGSGMPSPLTTLQQLAQDATRIADQLDAEVSDAIAQALRLLDYFGERRDTGANSASKEDELVERFFITLKDFSGSLEASWREVVEQPRKLRLEAVAGVVAANREEQRVSSPKMPTPGKEEKSAPEDAGPREAPKALKKPGLGLLAGEAVAAVRRRSRATPPARPAAFALGPTAAGASGPSWLLRNGAAASEVD